jgi:hypothetical protein
MPADQGSRPLPQENLPWQVERLPDGSTRVFGLIPGRSTLAEARSRLGSEAQVALIVAPGESGSLEVYDDNFSAGFVTGKMVLTLASTAEERAGMLERASKAEYMESTTRRVELGDADRVRAEGAAISAIVFIPAARLDEEIVLQRFGPPAERIRSDENREHFLYPDIGLDLQLDAKGKEVLQYVAPAEFARLRDPLMAKK